VDLRIEEGISMDPDHYEKVRRVLTESTALLQKLQKEMTPDKLPGAFLKQCNNLWRKEFPTNMRLDLSGANFSDMVFGGFAIILTGANLKGANLDRTWWGFMVHLSGADLTRATLRGARINGPDADGTIFREADLSEARIILRSVTRRKPADLTNANLTNASIAVDCKTPPGLILTGAQMDGCRALVAEEVLVKQAINVFQARLTPEQLSQVVWEDRSGSPIQVDPFLSPRQKGSGGCFIATAACGTDQAQDVVTLRRFREVVLRPNRFGRKFITAYEWGSPLIANGIKCSPLCRSLVRRLIVRPSRWLAEYVLAVRDRQD
jgi:hypothetical protein